MRAVTSTGASLQRLAARAARRRAEAERLRLAGEQSQGVRESATADLGRAPFGDWPGLFELERDFDLCRGAI